MNAPFNVTRDHAWSGSRYINVLDPQPEDINLWEIATGLSREQRFGGAATAIFWSVAQHVLLSLDIARKDGIEDRAILACLFMHDAPEYMLRDLIRPVKVNVPSYAPIEDAWWRAISERFGLPSALPEVVKHYDNLTLAVEKAALVSSRCGPWPGIPDPGDRTIPTTLLVASMQEVFQMFLAEARNLGIR